MGTRLNPLFSWSVFNGIDFEDYVTIGGEFITCVEADPVAIFDNVTVTKLKDYSKVQETDGKDDDGYPNDNETE